MLGLHGYRMKSFNKYFWLTAFTSLLFLIIFEPILSYISSLGWTLDQQDAFKKFIGYFFSFIVIVFFYKFVATLKFMKDKDKE